MTTINGKTPTDSKLWDFAFFQAKISIVLKQLEHHRINRIEALERIVEHYDELKEKQDGYSE